jgi:hypothetical protein
MTTTCCEKCLIIETRGSAALPYCGTNGICPCHQKNCCGECLRVQPQQLSYDKRTGLGVAGGNITRCINIQCKCHSPHQESWQKEFLNKGTELLGIDCSALIGTISSLLSKAREDEQQKSKTAAWYKNALNHDLMAERTRITKLVEGMKREVPTNELMDVAMALRDPETLSKDDLKSQESRDRNLHIKQVICSAHNTALSDLITKLTEEEV